MTAIEPAEVCPECSGQLRQREILKYFPEYSFRFFVYCSRCPYLREEFPIE